MGSLNIYDERTRNWSDGDVRAARVLADMAVGYVINASQLEQAERTREQLQEALESRVVIEQAKGMLANANGITIDEAFGRLRRHARSSRLPLREVATAVVESGLEIPAGGSGHRAVAAGPRRLKRDPFQPARPGRNSSGVAFARELDLELSPDVHAPQRVRAVLEAEFADLGDALFAAQVIASELVTNAILHGEPPVRLEVRSTRFRSARGRARPAGPMSAAPRRRHAGCGSSTRSRWTGA